LFKGINRLQKGERMEKQNESERLYDKSCSEITEIENSGIVECPDCGEEAINTYQDCECTIPSGRFLCLKCEKSFTV